MSKDENLQEIKQQEKQISQKLPEVLLRELFCSLLGLDL